MNLIGKETPRYDLCIIFGGILVFIMGCHGQQISQMNGGHVMVTTNVKDYSSYKRGRYYKGHPNILKRHDCIPNDGRKIYNNLKLAIKIQVST